MSNYTLQPLNAKNNLHYNYMCSHEHFNTKERMWWFGFSFHNFAKIIALNTKNLVSYWTVMHCAASYLTTRHKIQKKRVWILCVATRFPLEITGWGKAGGTLFFGLCWDWVQRFMGACSCQRPWLVEGFISHTSKTEPKWRVWRLLPCRSV